MIRARGLLLGGACFATLAGFTIAASAALPATSAGARPGAQLPGVVAAGDAVTTADRHRIDADDPLITLAPSQTLSDIEPPSGPTAGGNNVVLTGIGFTGSTDVNFGSPDLTPCPSSPCFTIDSDTQITVVGVPPSSAGPVDVNVVTPGGTTGNLTYTYFAAPTLTGLSPPSGSTAGGNNIVLTGNNFTGATDVNFGSSDLTPCPSSPCFNFDNDNQITVNGVPANAAGDVNVNVVTPGGTTGNATYTYVTPPNLTSLNPPSGSTSGGNPVVLTGTNFNTATDVNFGPADLTPCPSSPCFTVNSNTQITVTGVPAHAAGGVSVNAVNPGGTTQNLTYTYVTSPTLTSLSPPSGSTAGGNDVILTGSDFNGATDVNFGPSDLMQCPLAPCFTVNSNTQITVSSIPANAAGNVSVNVVTPGGTTGNLTYTYVTPPNLTSLNPPSGPTGGGNAVVLTGTNFNTATDVNFGPNDLGSCPSAPCFTVSSNTQITVNGVPAHAAGGVSVNVVNPGGTTQNLTYTYVTSPTLTSLSPTSGSTAGGNDVILTGSDFNGATDVNFGPSDLMQCPSAPCFTVDSGTQITVSGVPAHAAGGVSVNVVTPGGTTGNVTYTYLGAALTSVNPPSGSTAGGNNVILTGTELTGATDVNFGVTDINSPCGTGTCFTVDSSTQITVDSIPSHAAGDVNVNVVTPIGTTNDETYTYAVPAPTLTNLNPTSGPTGGGNSVLLTGTDFSGATDVNVGASDLGACPSAPCFTVDSSSQITATMPANAPGSVNVTVTTPGGTTGSLPYTYVAPMPTVTNVSPNAGGTPGGNTVGLTGTGFEAAGQPIVSRVNVGMPAITVTPCSGTPTSACFTVNSATSITIQVIPPGTGQVNITVTTPGGTSAISSANVYTYVASLPTVGNASPKFGATSGGAFVIVTGTNFGDLSQGFGATHVLFGNIDIPSSSAFPCTGSGGCFEQIDATTLDVYTPTDNNAGTVDITVHTPGGNSQAVPSDTYTYVAPGAFTAISPVRICDTRHPGNGISSNECNGVGKGTLGPNGTITAHITGSTQVPAGALAVVANITAINHGTSGTVVIAYPAGTSRPVASNINLAPGTAEANLTIVQLSPGGAITLFNSVGEADVIVDVEGYFGAPSGNATGAFHSIPPLRMCDSRGGPSDTVCSTATGRTSAPLLGGTWRRIVLSGVPHGFTLSTPHIPTDGTAAAAAFNLTGTAASTPTYLAVAVPNGSDACPTKAPQFSNVNPTPGISLPNRVISDLGPSGDICLFSAAGSINFVIDVNGWFGKATASPGAFFYSVPPTRVCDTRPTDGTRCQGQPLGANKSELVDIAGVAAVPAWTTQLSSPPVAVVANLTAVAGSAATVFTLYPSDETRPQASDLNPTAGEVIANLSITSLGQTGSSSGNVYLFNAVGAINAVLDVAGWFQ